MKDLFEYNETMKFDELVERLNKKDETNFDAGEFFLGSIFQLGVNKYSFDNGITNVEFIVGDENLVEELYLEDVKIIDWYEL